MPRGVPGSGPHARRKTAKPTKKVRRNYSRKPDIAPDKGINIQMPDGTRIENVNVENAVRFIQLLKDEKDATTTS